MRFSEKEARSSVVDIMHDHVIAVHDCRLILISVFSGPNTTRVMGDLVDSVYRGLSGAASTPQHLSRIATEEQRDQRDPFRVTSSFAALAATGRGY